MSSSKRSNNGKKTPLNTVTTRRSAASSSVSGITTPSRSNSRRNQQLESESASTAGLLLLASTSTSNDVQTPQRENTSAEQQEEAIERRFYLEVPAVGDSEDEESESEVDAKDIEHTLDHLAVFEADDEGSGIPVPDAPPVMYGAPAGWNPPTTIPEEYSDKPTPLNVRRGQPKNLIRWTIPENGQRSPTNPSLEGQTRV